MNDLSITAGEASLSPITLFLHADLVVKMVMIGLLLASLLTWTIIIGRGALLSRAERKNKAFEREFNKTDDIDRFYNDHAKSEVPAARIFRAGLAEWRRSTSAKKLDKDATRFRLTQVMASCTAEQVDRLSARLNLVATIGSVSPFVGLFGTVWGIMRSFADIAASKNTSFGAVAPGIAEALFATALGLFAAIPAVIAYNRMAHKLDRIEAHLHRFADSFHATLSRELDGEG
jgi:biopolymer transport protein TolQ